MLENVFNHLCMFLQSKYTMMMIVLMHLVYVEIQIIKFMFSTENVPPIVQLNCVDDGEVMMCERIDLLPPVIENNAIDVYIKRFSNIAVIEMEKYGIPASITLAQGLLESGNGLSTLATKCNNHFGIKCFATNCTKDHCSNFHDDSHKDFFRIYTSAWESFRAHSELLENKRYEPCHECKTYQCWANGLYKAGYATDPAYAAKLIKIIKDNGLEYYDNQMSLLAKAE